MPPRVAPRNRPAAAGLSAASGCAYVRNAITRLRGRAGSGAAGELMDCFYCLSLWLAAPFALVVGGRRRETPVVWLALSGAACLLERATREKGAWDVLWEEPAGGRGRDTADAREPRRPSDPAAQTATLG